MFIKMTRSGYRQRDGQQFAQGRFLILASCPELQDADGREQLYGAVRFVRLSQVGHFMMGDVRIVGRHVTLSGPFGSDGLPIVLRPEFLAAAKPIFKPVPLELARAYWTDTPADGERPNSALYRWARESF